MWRLSLFKGVKEDINVAAKMKNYDNICFISCRLDPKKDSYVCELEHCEQEEGEPYVPHDNVSNVQRVSTYESDADITSGFISVDKEDARNGMECTYYNKEKLLQCR